VPMHSYDADIKYSAALYAAFSTYALKHKQNFAQ